MKGSNNSKSCFSKEIEGLGILEFFPLDIEVHAKIIHEWVNQQYAQYWQMLDTSIQQVIDEYNRLCAISEYKIYMGYLNQKPTLLLEGYHPRHSALNSLYKVEDYDYGMHILVAPSEEKIKNFTWNIFRSVMDFLFTDPKIRRIVVEPDIRNEKIHLLNYKMGFVYDKKIKLDEKEAYLAFCTKQQFENAISKTTKENIMNQKQIISPEKSIEHLTPDNWKKANLYLIQKALTEFSHELILVPVLEKTIDGWGHYTLTPKNITEDISYTFRAKKVALDHWIIDRDSIKKIKNGSEDTLDLVNLIIDFKEELNFSAEVLPVYIEEIISTLYGRAQILNRRNDVLELVDADYQTIEGSTTGHPTFLANNGRIGFDTDDYSKYAPESQNELRLFWIAAKKDRCVFSTTESLTYEQLLKQELSPTTLEKFHKIIEDQHLLPTDYYYFPIHPWQWYNKMNPAFTQEIATQNILFLGEAEDLYKAQQSIRTFYNVLHPDKYYVKTALSVLNMGFMRGLSPYYMDATPAINDWVGNLVKNDDYLQQMNFIILKEAVAVGFRSEYFEKALQNNSTPYTKMLAALWRESPQPYLEKDQRLMTMAALLHIDNDGNALVKELIKKSGLTTKEWLSHYLDHYMMPLVHCFYKHDLVFMPHGENLILIIENYVPVKIIMKDIAEEIAVFDPEANLPENIKRIQLTIPDDYKLDSIFTDVFDCFFRYLSGILYEQSGFSDEEFWKLVADKIIEYQDDRPEMKEKFEKYNLFAPNFKRCCLNKLQIKNNKQMLNLQDPIGSLQFAGQLKNPLYEYKNVLA